jgi:hypothetical protein
MPVQLETPLASDDIVMYDVALPLRATFFPLGFPVEVATNSEAVIMAARQSWGLFRATSADAPILLNLAVTDDDDEKAVPRPQFRSQGHLMSIVADARNQIICDLERGSATGWITRRVAENTPLMRLRFMESSVMSVLVATRLAAMHAALVARRGVGIAFCGESYAGKSTLAYACARSGWTLISDDGTFLDRNNTGRYAVGNPYRVRFREDAKSLFPELADFKVIRRLNGALALEVPTADLGVETAVGHSVDHLVFLRRSRSCEARINRYSAAEALRWLEKATLYGPEHVRVAQRQAYRRLVDASAWELHYSDLSDAIHVLDQLGESA